MDPDRAAVVLFVDDQLVVIERERAGSYLVFPGGGVEPGETPAQAAVREAWEETGLRVEVSEPAFLQFEQAGRVEWFFRGTVTAGEFGSGQGPEFTGARIDRGTYRLARLTRRAAALGNLLPLPVAETVLAAWSTGHWPAEPLVVPDPETLVPRRVRGSAIAIRQDWIVLIEYIRDGERWYEIPGGGVEPGEAIAAATAREVFEETGLVATVGAEVATVFRYGHRQHFFVTAVAGEIADRAGLDLPPEGRPVWLRLADLPAAPVWPKRLAWRIPHWHATGWPASPVLLTDSIMDLDQPCDW